MNKKLSKIPSYKKNISTVVKKKLFNNRDAHSVRSVLMEYLDSGKMRDLS